MPSFAPWLPGQPPPWLSDPAPAGTDTPAEQEPDPFLAWAASQAAPASPVPDVAWAPPNYDFTEAEANPPNFDFTVDEANPAPPNFDFSVEEANPPQPIDPYPYKIGRPRPTRDPLDPYATPDPAGPDASVSPAPDVAFAAPEGKAAPSAPLRTLLATAPTNDQLDQAATDREMGASERLVDNTAPTPDEADAQAQEDLAQLYRRDPEAAVRAANDRVMAEETMRATARRKAADDEAMNLENAIKAREQARAKAAASRAQLEQEAQAMAESSPFEAHWASRSTLGKLGGIINGIVGGLMMPSTGGRNSGIDFMLKLADDDAQQKWKSIAARRELAGDAMASAEDDFRMQETIRAANRRSIMGALEAQLANLDPKGSAALRIGESLAALDAADRRAKDEMQAADEKRAESMIKLEQEQQKIDLDRAKAEDASKLAWAKFRRAGTGSAKPVGLFDDKMKLPREAWGQIVPGLDITRLPAGVPLSHSDVSKVLGLQGELGRQAADANRGARVGQEIDLTKGKLRVIDPRDPSKTLGEAKDEKAAETVAEVLGPSVQATETIDRLIRIAESSGGNSDILKNPDWQMITGDKAYLDNLIRVSERMGALDAGSQDLIGKMRGGVDPNSFVRNAAPGLKRLRDNIERKAKLTMNAAGIDGNGYKFPSLSAPEAAPKNETASRLMARPKRVAAQLYANAGALSRGEVDPGFDRAALDEAIAGMETGREDAEALAAGVAEAAANSPNPSARVSSARALWRLRAAGNPAAVQQFNKLSRDRQAAILRELPQEDRDALLLEIATGKVK